MQSLVTDQCNEIKEAIEEYKTLQENINFKYEASITVRDALYTLKMRSNDDQQKLVDSLSETFKSDVEELDSLRKKLEDLRPRLEKFDFQVYQAIHGLFTVYASLHETLQKEGTVSFPSIETKLKQPAEIAMAPKPFEEQDEDAPSSFEGAGGAVHSAPF